MESSPEQDRSQPRAGIAIKKVGHRAGNVHPVSTNPSIWESGYWVIAEATAERLVGADLYLHSGQLDASHFGGKILSYYVH